MPKRKTKVNPYRATVKDDYTVPDFRISLTEASLRGVLSHIYETAFQSVKIPLFSWVDIFAGAGASGLLGTVIRCFSSSITVHFAEWLVPILVILVSLILYIRKAMAKGDNKSMCAARDEAVNAEILVVKNHLGTDHTDSDTKRQ